MDKISNFFDLKVWQLAHQTVIKVYEIANNFPKHEKFGLSSQLTRAVVSIPTNIAEGCGRHSTKEFIQFLIISRGSLEECKYLIFLSRDLGYILNQSYEELFEKFNKVGKMLNGLINALRKKLDC